MNLLRPKTNTLEVYGRVSYHDKARAWNTIRFQKVILDKFPQLRNKTSAITFKLEFCESYDNTIKRIMQLRGKKGGVPLLLYLFQDDIAKNRTI